MTDKQKFFIYWSDYASAYLDEYDTKEEAEKAVSEIRELESKSSNGTQLHRVLRGHNIAYKDAEIVTRVEFL